MKTTTHTVPSLSRIPSSFRSQPFLLGAVILFFLGRSVSQAASATWKANPTSGDWNTAANWAPVTVPNGSADTATFAASHTTAISLSAPVEVNGIVFNSGASAFTVTVSNQALTISGAGITNNSGMEQAFLAGGAASGSSSSITFLNSASAGNATLMANGGPHTNTTGGSIQFGDDSDGGTAAVMLRGKGNLDIRRHNSSRVSIGSLDGDTGTVFLGSKELVVGTNNLSTGFLGVIKGSTGGSLTKVGTGSLKLGNPNSTYTGATTINGGDLIVFGTGRLATGSGPMLVNEGLLGGVGAIAGPAKVGTGNGPGASLSPGGEFVGELTIHKALMLSSDATYVVKVNRSTAQSDRVIAHGVKINPAAQFVFADRGSGTLSAGTTFYILINTAATPIAGTFGNLADGSSFTNNGNTYKASYTGGDGNDLTLTVQ